MPARGFASGTVAKPALAERTPRFSLGKPGFHVFPGNIPAPGEKRRDEVKAVEKDSVMKLSEKEKRLVELIRSTGYGEIRVAVRNGQPVLAEEVKKSFKL